MNITPERKAVNWQAICEGRDLLDEIAELEDKVERIQQGNYKPVSTKQEPGSPYFTAGDTLDY